METVSTFTQAVELFHDSGRLGLYCEICVTSFSFNKDVGQMT